MSKSTAAWYVAMVVGIVNYVGYINTGDSSFYSSANSYFAAAFVIALMK
tara:strand:- start:116 stop:262 length:147 start_codon:yes stop_codon:yes gene_type:complete